MGPAKWIANGRAALLAVTCFGALAAEPHDTPISGDVHVFLVPSAVPLNVVLNAKASAASMFQSIGVRIIWDRRDEPTAAEGIHVRIEISDHSRRDSHPEVLAYAHPYGSYPRSITILHDRIEELAFPSHRLEQSLLAHVLVHEITHVLQGISRHSDRGVMKSHWGPTEYSLMQLKPLPFTPTDVDLIWAGLARGQGANASRTE
jgi:hypothetical protein